MKTTTIAAAVLIVVGMVSAWKPKLNDPITTPTIDPPGVDVQKIVSPITGLLKGFSEQAGILASFYSEASKTIRRDGENEKIVKTKLHLRTFCGRSTTLRFQETFEKIPGLASAIHGEDGALSEILGLEPGILDHEKASEAFHAIAWACQEAM